MFYFYKSIIFVPLFHSVYILLLLLHCFIILGIIIYLNNCFCLSSFVFLYFSLSSFFWNSLSFCVIVNFYWHQTIFFFFFSAFSWDPSVFACVKLLLWPYGLYPARLLCPWNSPGNNTRVDCPTPLQSMPSSRRSSWPSDWTHIFCVSCIGRQVLYHSYHLGIPWGYNLHPSVFTVLKLIVLNFV